MAEQVSDRIRIDAPPQRCYEVAIDYERYPEWAKDIKQATVLERDAEGRGAKVEYRAAAYWQHRLGTVQRERSKTRAFSGVDSGRSSAARTPARSIANHARRPSPRP